MTFGNTAIIMLDTHSDYLYENGQRHTSLRESLDETNNIANLQELIMAARIAQMPIVYGMHQSPKHHLIETHSHNIQWHGADSRESLFDDDIDEGSWEAEIYRGVEPKSSNGNVIVSRHWKQSAFANTNLDYQLKKRNITNVVIAGLISGTRFASTARYASELGYHVTILVDAISSTEAAAEDVTTALICQPQAVHQVSTVSEWAGALFHY